MKVQIEDVSEEIRGRRAAGADLGAAAARRGEGRHRSTEVLPRHERDDCGRRGGHFAHRLHRRSRVRDLDARRSRAHGVGRADGRRPAVRHQACRHARARRRAHRGGAAAHRSGLLQLPQGDDPRADVFAVRARAWTVSCRSTRAASSASARCARSTRAVRRDGSSASRSTGTKWRRSTTPPVSRLPSPPPRHASRSPSIATAARWAGRRPRRGRPSSSA